MCSILGKKIKLTHGYLYTIIEVSYRRVKVVLFQSALTKLFVFKFKIARSQYHFRDPIVVSRNRTHALYKIILITREKDITRLYNYVNQKFFSPSSCSISVISEYSIIKCSSFGDTVYTYAHVSMHMRIPWAQIRRHRDNEKGEQEREL